MNSAPPTDRQCDNVLLVQAELDGELDAAAAAALAAHRTECPVCQAAAAELTRARALIDTRLYQPMPDDVRRRVMARLAGADSPKATSTLPSPAVEEGASLHRWWTRLWTRWLARWWASGASFGLGAACAAVVLLVLTPRAPDLAEQIVAGHIRALQPGHLEDVVSTDRHTVKPWFEGRVAFAPPVKDLAAERFALRGGRLDYAAGRPVGVLVYQRDKHIIDLFIWPAESSSDSPETAQRQGYNLVRWTADGMSLWAVSDIEATQLREFAEAWRRSRN